MKQYVLITTSHKVVHMCDHLWQAMKYAKEWKDEYGNELYIYEMERFY